MSLLAWIAGAYILDQMNESEKREEEIRRLREENEHLRAEAERNRLRGLHEKDDVPYWKRRP